MKMRIVVGSLVSAVVLFFWGFAYWGVLAMTVSPWNAIAADSDPDVIATLKQAFPESGVYMYPWVDSSTGDDEGASKEFERQHAEGPIVQIFYHANGIAGSEMGMTMGLGFVHMLISSVFCCILLAMAEPLCCYGSRVGFVFGLGVFSSLWIEGADLIWWHFPLSHVLFMSAYNIIAWLLAGLVIAAIVKKPQAMDKDDAEN